MRLTHDYDRMMKLINSDYRLPIANSQLFITSTPGEVYSSNYGVKASNNKSQILIKPIKILGINNTNPNINKSEENKSDDSEDSNEEVNFKDTEFDLLNGMQNELKIQESLADDLKHYLNYESIFDSGAVGSLTSSLNETLPYERKKNKEIAIKRFSLRRTTNRQNLDLYDPNRMIEISDEEMLLKVINICLIIFIFKMQYIIVLKKRI